MPIFRTDKAKNRVYLKIDNSIICAIGLCVTVSCVVAVRGVAIYVQAGKLVWLLICHWYSQHGFLVGQPSKPAQATVTITFAKTLHPQNLAFRRLAIFREPESVLTLSMADCKILILGAGLAGLGMAAQLQRQLNSDDFEIYEKLDNIGGTWAQNAYKISAATCPPR